MSGKPGQQGTKATEVPARYDEDFLDAMDGRFEVARTLRHRLGQLTADLGGLAGLSYQERSLCRRIVHLERHVEKKELSLAHGGTLDENSYFAAINGLSGLFSKIGLKRRAKQLPTLGEYLSGKAAAPSVAKAPAPTTHEASAAPTQTTNPSHTTED